MKKHDPKISVVIPVHSSSIDFLKLHRSLQKQAGRFETIFVFNPGPAPHWFSLDFEGAILHSNKVGVNQARNLGIQHAKGEWIYFLDSDCSLPNSDHIKDLENLLVEIDSNTVLGGRYLLDQFQGCSNSFSISYHQHQTQWINSGHHSQYGQIHFLGGNLLIHRDTLRENKFDGDIVFGGAETELIYRLLRKGCQGILLNGFDVVHSHNLSESDVFWKAFFQGYTSQLCLHRETHIRPEYRLATGKADRIDSDVYQFAFSWGQEWFSKHFRKPNAFERAMIGIFRNSRKNWKEKALRREKLWRTLSWMRDSR